MSNDILTAAGHYFDFDKPDQCKFGIDEIAHALSHLCRFTGHTRRFYSVAQHSVLVSKIVPREFALEGLLHDAAEAFIGDVAKPLKKLLPDYQALERRVEAAVFSRLGINPELPACVKRADLIMLVTERRDLMPYSPGDSWTQLDGVQPLPERVSPVRPDVAFDDFLSRYRELIRERSRAQA